MNHNTQTLASHNVYSLLLRRIQGTRSKMIGDSVKRNTGSTALAQLFRGRWVAHLVWGIIIVYPLKPTNFSRSGRNLFVSVNTATDGSSQVIGTSGKLVQEIQDGIDGGLDWQKSMQFDALHSMHFSLTLAGFT